MLAALLFGIGNVPVAMPEHMKYTPKDPLSIGPFYEGRPGTGFTVYGRPGRNGRGAAADKRRARKARGVRLHKQRCRS